MVRYFPGIAAFSESAGRAEVIPVYRQLLADHLTPVSAFELLSRDAEHCFLLESVVGGEKIARYSFIATSPSVVYQATGPEATISRGRGGTEVVDSFQTTDPLADLQKLIPPKKYEPNPKLPTFTGGLVGYAGYDTIRYYEGGKLTAPPADDRHLPDVLFGLYGEMVVFDHVDKTIRVIANAEVTVGGANTVAAYRSACERIDALVTRLQQPISGSLGEIDPAGTEPLSYTSNLSRGQYEAAVRTGQEYIRAGDIFQFVPSQRVRVMSAAAPLDVYRALRVINPSPFMFYLKSPKCTLIGSSPEILCRVTDRVATSRPLAGTRRRGKTDEEDRQLEAELLADPKERAEHIMLVDLHRNDLGRVAKIGTVVVSDSMTVERYSHVMHITTHVTATLADDQTALDALRASLPVGTVSGAPKIRAMQIIDEVEPTRRGPYGGAVGYLDLAGNMDTCIALRTIVHTGSSGGAGAYDIQAGAGVVADSVPATEYEETMSKAMATLKAVEIAQAGF